jgi:hypothetical protein
VVAARTRALVERREGRSFIIELELFCFGLIDN